jgi:DeoR family glycerol-3-phosphate regulon repressor
MEPVTPRQADIVTLIRSEGRATVEALAERFHVTRQTIRKDLELLGSRGLVQRFHGGARRPR